MAQSHRANVSAQANRGVVIPTVGELIEELRSRRAEKRQPGDLDVSELEIKTGARRDACYKLLEKMARDGLVVKVPVVELGHWKYMYRPIRGGKQ